MSNLPVTPERWRDILDTALEHASHSWHALQKSGLAHVQDLDRQTWPPQCIDEPGSAAYHMAAMISYVFEVYSGIFSLYPDDEDDVGDIDLLARIVSAEIRDPQIHWFAFDCDHHMSGDSFTNAPALVTCGICKRHVEFILPRLRSRVLTMAST